MTRVGTNVVVSFQSRVELFYPSSGKWWKYYFLHKLFDLGYMGIVPQLLLITEAFTLREMLCVGHTLQVMSAHQQEVKVTGVYHDNLINDGFPTPTSIRKKL